MKKTIGFCILFTALTGLSACGQSTPSTTDAEKSQESSAPVVAENKTDTAESEIAVEATNAPEPSTSNSDESGLIELAWDDLMPDGEDELLAELYSDFYEDMEKRMRQQITLADKTNPANSSVADMITEGSAQDTMEQIGTYNVVNDLDGKMVRIPGYIVPLDFKANSEYTEFLLVPYFGACLHTPPPPPNQIVYVKANPAAKVPDIYEPFWLEGKMKTGKFTSDIGNSAYEIDLSKLEAYEY